MPESKLRITYSSPTQRERREIEEIRRRYLPLSREEGNLHRLRRLHRRVYGMARGLSIAIGVSGILLFGLGLTFALEWSIIKAAIPLAAAGLFLAALAYPAYALAIGRGKRKYGKEILALSEELLKEKE